MANLTQHARLPILNGSILPLGIGVNTAIDDVPYNTGTVKTSQIHPFIGLPIWANRNISLNPAMAYGLRPMALGENMSAAYYDQVYEIRGTVKDSDGNPMSRRVIVLTRDGTRLALLRSGADGTFKTRIWNYGLNRVLVVAIPDDGDLRNAVVKWGSIGVDPI